MTKNQFQSAYSIGSVCRRTHAVLEINLAYCGDGTISDHIYRIFQSVRIWKRLVLDFILAIFASRCSALLMSLIRRSKFLIAGRVWVWWTTKALDKLGKSGGEISFFAELSG